MSATCLSEISVFLYAPGGGVAITIANQREEGFSRHAGSWAAWFQQRPSLAVRTVTAGAPRVELPLACNYITLGSAGSARRAGRQKASCASGARSRR